ncbi:hypothetical protein CPC08DRAFT_418783 [Agrocybe pediades]|nr:hypothetical protein CPC08DRAFT_418783 [Agrocybe pediades]
MPLKQQFTQHRAPCVIVIDGLDECVDRASQKTILIGLVDSVRDSNPFIRIFVASRPEHDIKLSFSSKNLKDIHSHLSLDLDNGNEADTGINLYLCEPFAQIQDDLGNRTSVRKLDPSCPGGDVIDGLVRNSSSQFIHAATVHSICRIHMSST